MLKKINREISWRYQKCKCWYEQRKRDENSLHRKSKVSYSTSVGVGLVGPKENPKGASDGYQVNIPKLHITREGGTDLDIRAEK